jgi:hypothetical protein
MKVYDELAKDIKELDTVVGMLLVPAMSNVPGVKEAMEKVVQVSIHLGEVSENLIR